MELNDRMNVNQNCNLCGNKLLWVILGYNDMADLEKIRNIMKILLG